MEHHRQVKSKTDQNVKKTTTGREEGQEGGGDSGGRGEGLLLVEDMLI